MYLINLMPLRAHAPQSRAADDRRKHAPGEIDRGVSQVEASRGVAKGLLLDRLYPDCCPVDLP